MSKDVLVGQLLTGEVFRDAIHIAIAPVSCKLKLRPGQKIELVAGSMTEVIPAVDDIGIGIVDPFLGTIVPAESKFYMFLYPRTITSLRHEWTHPAFKPLDKTESEEFLEKMAVKLDTSVSDVIQTVIDAATYGSAHAGDDTHQGIMNDNKEELLRHVEIVTGKSFTEEQKKEAYFSCAC